MLYLAAIDETIKPTDGYTLETRFEHFIDELALIGRAHNWDESRFKVDADNNLILDEDGNPIEEEYDNLKGDKPSCYSGVKRRLFQAVLGHLLLKILTKEDIQSELRDFIREYFRESIVKNGSELKQAWEEYLLNQ